MIPDLVGAANQISMVIDDVRDIAKTDIGGAHATAQGSMQGFRGLPVDLAAYSEVPLAQELGVQHRAAHEVFSETIAGVLKDLEDFRDKLLACADSHETNDTMVQDALLALGRSYRHHQYASTRNYDHGRRQAGDDLASSHARDKAHGGSSSGAATASDSGAHPAAVPGSTPGGSTHPSSASTSPSNVGYAGP